MARKNIFSNNFENITKISLDSVSKIKNNFYKKYNLSNINFLSFSLHCSKLRLQPSFYRGSFEMITLSSPSKINKNQDYRLIYFHRRHL
jgi:hypothetical protein